MVQVIGIQWYMHHEIFKAVREVDGKLWWLNYAFLMFVSSLPFYAELMATFISESSSYYYIGALCFGMILMGSLQLSVWLHVLYYRTRHDQSSYLFSLRMVTVMTLALAVTPCMATVTFFVALGLSPSDAIWVLCLIPITVVALFALFGAPWSSLRQHELEETQRLHGSH